MPYLNVFRNKCQGMHLLKTKWKQSFTNPVNKAKQQLDYEWQSCSKQHLGKLRHVGIDGIDGIDGDSSGGLEYDMQQIKSKATCKVNCMKNNYVLSCTLY